MTGAPVYRYVPYSGYPQVLPTASGAPMGIVIDATAEAAFRRLWGMTLLERNLRLVERLGGRRIHVVVRAQDRQRAGRRRFSGDATPHVEAVTGDPIGAVDGLVRRAQGPVILLQGQGVYDRRVLAALWQQQPPALGTEGGQPLEALMALVDGGQDLDVAGVADWAAWTRRRLGDEGVRRLDLADVESRVSLLRKTVAPRVFDGGAAEGPPRADAYLKQLAGKGVNDLIGEFVHPPIEFLLTRLVAQTPLTPNAVSYLIVLLSMVGLYLFATGRLWEGIAVNLVRGVVDGVDGKLARLTLRETKNGNVLDHGTDTAYLPLLFLAFGWSLSAGQWLSGPAVATGLLQVCYWLNRVFASWFRTFLGADESEFRAVDRFVRRFEPKRNIFILILIVAMACGSPRAGLYAIAVLTAAFMLYRMARLDFEGRRRQGKARAAAVGRAQSAE